MPGFTWFRVPTGYRLEPAVAGTPGTLVSEAPQGARIVPLSGERETYHPLDRVDALYGVFSKVVDADSALDFVRKFGPLTLGGDDVETVVSQAKHMRDVLHMHDRGTIAERISGIKLVPLGVSLIWNPATQKFEFEFKPKDLLNALWFQLAQTLAGGCEIHACKHCGEWFPAGPGTPRRIDAEFCSKTHKTAWHSLNRSAQKPVVRKAKQAKRKGKPRK